MMTHRKSSLLLTTLALVAFASNSLLCRKALGSGGIDPAAFTTIRLAAGAMTLGVIVRLRAKPAGLKALDRVAAVWLFLYAAAFSFAYVSLHAGTGALILFAAVQLTMITAGYRAGERLSIVSWMGILLSFGGLIFLVFPGLTAPPLHGAGLMAVAGIAWGLYSLRSRGADDALSRTAGNFLGAVPLALVLSLLCIRAAHVSVNGFLLAMISGAVTSGLGYVIWYAALRQLTSTAAASVQLAVPVLAALGGIALLGEPFTLRLLVASLIILTGIALVLKSRAAQAVSRERR